MTEQIIILLVLAGVSIIIGIIKGLRKVRDAKNPQKSD
jgi:hypothetical protein